MEKVCRLSILTAIMTIAIMGFTHCKSASRNAHGKTTGGAEVTSASGDTEKPASKPTVQAVPAIPRPVVFTQPNGDTLTVRIKGDERKHWHESMDEYTLLFNRDGYLTYARLDEDGNLQPSGFIATDIEKRSAAVNDFLNTIEKKLFLLHNK